MSFHQDSFHQQRGLRDKVRRLDERINGIEHDAFERIFQLEKQIEKILDKKSEYWVEED